MKVTAGIAKGHTLYAPKGFDTRPTADKIKQSVFNIIEQDLNEARFLDMFAGTGQIGIEALSRGAKECTFIEKNKEAMRTIINNLEHTKLKEKACIYMADTGAALNLISRLGKTYSIIFMDPPYDKATDMHFLVNKIKELNLLEPFGYIIFEHGTNVNISNYKEFSVFKQKKYGKTTVISFFTPI